MTARLRLDNMNNMVIAGRKTAGNDRRAEQLPCTVFGFAWLAAASAAARLLLLGITASPAELNEYHVDLDIADGSAEATYYLLCPHAGVITRIDTVIDGAVATADITVTGKIGATGITDGVVTIATAGSAAGDLDTCAPSALNVVTAGQAINFTVTGGGAGGTPRIHLVATIERT